MTNLDNRFYKILNKVTMNGNPRKDFSDFKVKLDLVKDNNL